VTVTVMVNLNVLQARSGASVPANRAQGLDATSTEAQPPLASLLAKVARGDEDAFAPAYDQLAPTVFGVALKVLRDRTQAEEIAQDVLLEVWVKAARFDPRRGSARGWVATIAHRRAVDRMRSMVASRRRETSWALTTPEPDPVSQIVVAELQAQEVRCAMTMLTQVQRRAVELAFYEGLTHREIAKRLGIPIGTAKTRIRDGLKRLSTGLQLMDADPT
jgi:RNA polymerase sigma-70 factor, ECF subfamily